MPLMAGNFLTSIDAIPMHRFSEQGHEEFPSLGVEEGQFSGFEGTEIGISAAPAGSAAEFRALYASQLRSHSS